MTLLVAAALAVALAAPGAGAHDDGTTGHLWQGHLKPMKTPGTINDPGNPVDWSKLKGVPQQIVDADDGVEVAGIGLWKWYSIFNVDARYIQRRLANSCQIGQSIRSIAENGNVTCSAGPRGLTLRATNLGPLCNSSCTYGTLVLTPGKWAITGQMVARQSDPDADHFHLECHLDAGGKSDKARVEFFLDGAATIPMQLIATMSGNLHATVNCGDSDDGELIGSDLSIVAIRLED